MVAMSPAPCSASVACWCDVDVEPHDVAFTLRTDGISGSIGPFTLELSAIAIGIIFVFIGTR